MAGVSGLLKAVTESFEGRKVRFSLSDFTVTGIKLKYGIGVVCNLCVTPTSLKDYPAGTFLFGLCTVRV